MGSAEQLLDALAIQIDGRPVGERHIVVQRRFADAGEEHVMTLKHGVLTHRRGAHGGSAGATIATDRSTLNEVIGGTASIEEIAG